MLHTDLQPPRCRTSGPRPDPLRMETRARERLAASSGPNRELQPHGRTVVALMIVELPQGYVSALPGEDVQCEAAPAPGVRQNYRQYNANATKTVKAILGPQNMAMDKVATPSPAPGMRGLQAPGLLLLAQEAEAVQVIEVADTEQAARIEKAAVAAQPAEGAKAAAGAPYRALSRSNSATVASLDDSSQRHRTPSVSNRLAAEEEMDCHGGRDAVADRGEAAADGELQLSQLHSVTKDAASGRQEWLANVYVEQLGGIVDLGSFDNAVHAAEAYDIMMLRFQGIEGVQTNFPLKRYERLLPYLGKVWLQDLAAALKSRCRQDVQPGRTPVYVGVTHCSGAWQARLQLSERCRLDLGVFLSKRVAVAAYDKALVRVLGPTAATNFPIVEYLQELAEYRTYQQVCVYVLSYSSLLLQLYRFVRDNIVRTDRCK
ncbi:hypothetical protein VOLCADRAFT_93984 [Volvox carteri f. nagariensis]|uniref:AP2/ERF domain-containing protein n=1 Tax=Volvox carteri f. nagariensis TaxID=3068 RepID=D8U3L5_VOLCA|nr:uncharacterized protein VOLCADRAFT_93984 [Volvox carteri f. nagariensis]EFJ45551.1 hypothetical protein VOLCADRAFT_93984 [Volvox carteri f. nagariensis]|eukprot:XP_002953241.1 hypothetical protein VOLCADRAFT_93984 [Volvox carteri f. nagariensis]